MNVEVANAASDTLGRLFRIAARGDRVWAIGGQWDRPVVLRSGDGGRTFVKPRGDPDSTGLRDVWLDDDAVWVVGEVSEIARTTDDGATWESVKHVWNWSAFPFITVCLYAIDRDADGALWVTGDDGILMRSATGASWERVPTATKGRLLALCRDGSGGAWLLDGDGVIQRWRGDRFVAIETDAMLRKRPLTYLARTPAGSLIVIGDDGLVLRSTTDGASWTKVLVAPAVDHERLVITRFGMFVVGDAGLLAVSYDDGRSFAAVPTAMTGHLWSVIETASGLLVTGEHGAIWRVPAVELVKWMQGAHPIAEIRDLAGRIADGEDGAMLVLEDALREHALW